MVGIMWIIVLAIIGGIVAFVGDKIGSKVGKKRLSVFGLRPYHTSIIMTIFTGIVIVAVTITTLATLSTDVHTALFDMQKIRAEISNLNIENENAKKEVNAKNVKIKQLDVKIKEASESVIAIQKSNDELEAKLKENKAKNEATEIKLKNTKNEVARLNRSKENLKQIAKNLTATIEESKKEITDLEASTNTLKNSIMAVREGEVIFRSDEAVFSGVLKGAVNKKEAQTQFATFAIAANRAVLKRLGIEKETQILYLSKAEVEGIVSLLQVTTTPLYVKINAAGNTINGEPVLAKIKTYDEKVIYNKGTLICEKKINLKTDKESLNQELGDFFKKLNQKGIEKGLIPDPISGQVGQIPIKTVKEAVDKIKKANGTVILKAYAKNRIMTSGPLIPRLEVDTLD